MRRIKEKLYSINEIVSWYKRKCEIEISDDFIIYLINKGIIKQKEISQYSLEDVNAFLLETYDNAYVMNDEGKLKIKENRKKIIEKYPKKEDIKPKKFKITALNGNKLKLIKLN